jgi:hypothetical protein
MVTVVLNGQRVTWSATERLLPRLSDRDWSIIDSLESARVLSGHQLSRLHFHDLSD